MIDLIKFTPAKYSVLSRDYQVLCRLYTILYNNTKMYIDSMNVWNSKIDNKLVTLKSRTVNFVPKHTWDLDELKTVVSCFKYLCRHKGTVDTLYYCINILMKVQGINSQLVDGAITYNNGDIVIKMDSDIIAIGVVEDLIEYLIPAGCTYRIIKYSEVTRSDTYETEMFYGEDTFENSKEIYVIGKMKIGSDKEPTYFDDTVVWNGKEENKKQVRKKKVTKNVNKK